jgi:hypothetical protein
LWCQTNPSFSTQPIHDVQGSGSRVSTTLSFGCTASGRPTDTLPDTFPDSVGITLDGMDVWVSPKGLQTHPEGKPFSVT